MIGPSSLKRRKYSTFSFERTTLGSSVNGEEDSIGIPSFRKGSADLNSFANNYKTQVCKYWEAAQSCPFAQTCIFAHGDDQIRDKDGSSSKYKTKLCKKFHQSAFCPYGQRCQFIHNRCENSAPEIKRQQLFKWFGTQLAILMWIKKQRPQKAIIDMQLQLQNCEKISNFPDQYARVDSLQHHPDTTKCYLTSEFQIWPPSGFTKPRLYSL